MTILSSVFVLVSILCFVIVQTAPWNSICTVTEQCDGPNTMMICRNGRCACNQPWFRACNNTCVPNPGISYERDRCIVPVNCINYTICNDGRCQCLPDYTAVNGVCLKRLNASCTLSNECWSQYCFTGRCQCAPGFEPRSDLIRCRRRLVLVFNDWLSANSSNETCVDQGSCIDFRANCVNETILRSRSYCKCPEGYQASIDNRRCDSVENNQLSPLDELPSEYQPCGFCQDDNAACMRAANRTTCWCRAGYGRIGSQCVIDRRMSPPVIFPNGLDRSIHDYSNNCTGLYNNTNTVEGGICTCARDWRYVGTDQACEKIEVTWINDIYEYGLCTRINSYDQALPEEGLCPFPLNCEARQDKYVCSCGRDRYLDYENSSSCVYYIGRVVVDPTSPCPRNAEYNTTAKVCQCLPGYIVVDESRRCQLILSQEVGRGSCILNSNLDRLCQGFSNRAFYCRPGECRCDGEQSFPYENGTRCYAPVEQFLTGSPERCPPNSYLDNSRCRCCQGYQSTGDSRRCDLISAQLNEFSTSTVPEDPFFSRQECQNPFDGSVQYLGGGSWQCSSDSFINDNRTGCWYRLLVQIDRNPRSTYCPPKSDFKTGPFCECNRGYEPLDNICVLKTQFVFAENDTNAIAKVGLIDDDCIYLFGNGAKLSINGQYCVCKPEAYPVNFNTYCRFRINQYTVHTKSENTTCPENSEVRFSSNGEACVCKAGFYSSEDLTTCDLSNATLSGTIDLRGNSNCISVRDEDCRAKFGQQALCVNDTCFCNRRTSFINSIGRCEPFANYIFPGIHERNYYTCDIDEDCGNPLAVKCDYLVYDPQYKVCQCRDGWLLDPVSRTCVEKRCQPECNTTGNFICQNYDCVCRPGYYLNGTNCFPLVNRLELDQVCERNRTDYFSYWLNYDRLQCNSSCGHARCLARHKVEGFRCVPFYLEQEQCLFRTNLCKELDPNAFCNSEENVCNCAPTYYRLGETCVKAVESRCVRDEDCGGKQLCKGQRCQCNNRQRRRATVDIYGRRIDLCVNRAIRKGIPLFIFVLFPFASFFFI